MRRHGNRAAAAASFARKRRRALREGQRSGQQVPSSMGALRELTPPIGVAYDEHLLDRAKTQWQFGDWQSLVRLDLAKLDQHPDRASLALLAAAAQLQVGDTEKAGQLIGQARDWGCAPKLVARVLVAGVHNSLGRAAAVSGQASRALRHIELAVGTLTPGAVPQLVAQARLAHTLAGGNASARNTPEQTALGHSAGARQQRPDHAGAAVIRIDESKVAEQCARLPAEDFINASFDVQGAAPTRDVLVIFSTPRSGSTLLCDVLRKNGMCLAHEYFQPFEYLPLLAQRWGCIDNGELVPDRFVERLCRYRTFANGWLGINLHGSHIPVFQRFIEFFPDVRFHYMHLYRRDLVAQAVSLNLAVQTGMWSSHFRPSDDQRVPEYDFAAIEAARREIEQQNLLVRAFLADRRLECRDVVYEDLIAGSSELGEYLATLFGRTGEVEFRTDLRKQGSSLNDVWREMYCRQVVEQKRDTRIGLVDFA